MNFQLFLANLPPIFRNRIFQITVGITLIIITIFLIGIFNTRRPVRRTQTTTSRVTLTWWKPTFLNPEAYKQVIDEFKKIPANAQIDIEIKSVEYPNNYYRNLLVDFSKGVGPDIFSIRNDDLPAYKEYLSEIRPLSGGALAEYKNNFASLAVRDTMDRDKVYGITTYIENLQLYYNKSILNQAGVPLVPATWSDLDKQLSLLNKRDLARLNFLQSAISLGTGGRGNEGPANINRFEDILPALIFQSGAQLYDYQTQKSTFGQNQINTSNFDTQATSESSRTIGINQNDAIFKAIKFYADFADPNSTRYSWNNNSNNNIDAFRDGKLAYMVHYSYMEDTLRRANPRLDFGIAPLPQLNPNNKKTYGFFFMDAINRNLENNPESSAKREAAEKFLAYLSTKEAQSKIVGVTKQPAAHKAVIDEQLRGSETIRTFANGSLIADNYYKPDVARTEQMWSDLIKRVQIDGTPLSQSYTRAIAEYNAIVQQEPQIRTD